MINNEILRTAKNLAEIIQDYRSNESRIVSIEHVIKWVQQFEPCVRLRLLTELTYVLNKSYISYSATQKFLIKVSEFESITGNNPLEYWKYAHILNIQNGGQSQSELTAIFKSILFDRYGVLPNDSPSPDCPVVYIDDVVFSGNRVYHDILSWLPHCGLNDIKLEIVVIGLHRGGKWYADRKIIELAEKYSKKISVRWWRLVELEDRKAYTAKTDVLRPRVLPKDPLAQRYEQYLTAKGYPPIYRHSSGNRSSQFFSSEDGRDFLEEQLLLAGLRILSICQYFPEKIRPLGYSSLKTFGFGSLIVTYRNCPNTSALALWAGDPWYPLLPRKVNNKSRIIEY